MKKILFSVTICFFCVCGTCFAACNSPTTIAYDGNQEVDDDEFLYPDESNYLAAKHGYENSKHKTSGDGKAYECDRFNAKVCGDDDQMTLPAGHYFGGQRVDVKTTYECYARAMWNDGWKPVSKDVCSAPVYGDIKVGEQYSKHLTIAECSGYTITDHDGVEFALTCKEGPMLVCKAVKCIDGMTVKEGKCVPSGSTTPTPKPDKKTCKELRASEEGKACCDLSETEASWNGKNCICLGGKDFKIVGDKGTCVVKEQGNASVVCPEVDLNYFVTVLAECKNDSGLVQLVTQIKALCGKTGVAEQYNTLFATIKTYVEVNCKATVVPDNSAARNAIIAAGGVLDSIVAGLDTSKWKNEEGKFNTARLASDSIAGVVLGTAGGLITSSVVKKNQIENGFEDMRCTVGGQAVADWGDEFSVGRK